MPAESSLGVFITFTIVLLCRMKVWKPNQRSFMHSSNATMTKASSSRVAWTYRGIEHTVRTNGASKFTVWCVRVCVFAHVDVQAQRGYSGGFTQRQHHQQQACQQLHHVEQVVVGKQVRRQRLRVPRMGEEFVIVLSLLYVKDTEKQQ